MISLIVGVSLLPPPPFFLKQLYEPESGSVKIHSHTERAAVHDGCNAETGTSLVVAAHKPKVFMLSKHTQTTQSAM